MRSLRLAVLPLLVATSLAAQSPPSPSDAPSRLAGVAPARGVFFDLSALAGGRARFGIEPLRIGDWTLDVVAGHARTSTVLLEGHVLVPPATPGPIGSKVSDGWSFDVAVRYYPAPLAIGGPHRGLAPYVEAFVGFESRTFRLESDAYSIDPLTGLAVPDWGPSERLTGFEPGAEIGLRVMTLRPVFVDVGGWFQLVTLDDPGRSIRPGRVDARLVAAIGVGW